MSTRSILADQITIPPRQRLQKPPAHIKDLKSSILSKGLMHAPVLGTSPEGDLFLVAGECRLTAMKELHIDGHPFKHDGATYADGLIPYSLVSDLTPADLAEAELEENLLRANLSWQEENQARVLIYQLRQTQTPDISVKAVATEISEKSGKTSDAERVLLRKALIIEQNKDLPIVKAAKTQNEAFTKIMDLQAARFKAQLIERGVVKVDHTIHLGDCLEILPTIAPGSVDIILTDPPYGIGADKMKRTEEHFYDDSPGSSLEVCKAIIREGFRILKPRGIIFLFCDIDHFLELRTYAAQQAFTPWRTPVIWKKGEEGFAPWGQLGFSRTYEMLAFLSKGQRGLKGGGPDVKEFKRTGRSERAHAAEKPVTLLSYLLGIAGDPGDVVLDPCCGSGAIFDAATENRMKAIGIEKDPNYHTLAQARLVKEEPIHATASAANGLDD